jgi:malonyl-CoA/methylmalonyl-CoA synthetase
VVAVPISLDLPIKEATYFATKCKSSMVLTANKCLKLGRDLENVMRNSANPSFQCVEIASHLMQTPLPLEEIIVSSDKYFDMNKSGMIIFTSGTTGPPKGAVKRRGFFIDVATMFSDQYDMREGDLVLHVLPVHHATGVTLTLLPFLWAGGTIEFRSGGFDVAWTWERMKKGDLDFFSGVPTIYMRLMAYHEQQLSKLPASQRQQYDEGARRIRSMLCGTSALPRPLQNKWTRLRGGKPILTRYGLTEAGNAFNVAPWLESVPDGTVGPKMAGVDVKLTAYPEGEILIKSPIMFSKYLFDREATAASLDEEGYFKTGDIARKEGDHYFILGRASVDIIKSGGYKISALDIEREILGLDYVAEVMVVGIEDEEFGQRVAAAIVLKPDVQKDGLTLERLRADLRSSLAGYKMPTLLRVVDELRKNATGKVIKKVLIPEYFPSQDAEGVQKWAGKKSKL